MKHNFPFPVIVDELYFSQYDSYMSPRVSNDCTFFEERSITNRSNKQLVVCRRDGIKVPFLVSNIYPQKDVLEFNFRLKIPAVVKNNLTEILSVRKKLTDLLNSFSNVVNVIVENNQIGGYFEFCYSICIDLNDVEKNGGVVYYPELDVLISLKDIYNPPDHPFSQEGAIKRFFDVNIDKEVLKDSLNLSMVLIDNAGQIGAKWTKLPIGVVKIVPIKNPELKDGVYIHHCGKETYIRPDEFLTNGIYLSEQEAENDAGVILKIKEKLVKLEAELSLEKQQRAIEAEKSAADLAREKHQNALEIERLTLRSEVRKDLTEDKRYYQENRSMDRKDSSEVIKIVGSVLVGAGAIFLAIKKFF